MLAAFGVDVLDPSVSLRRIWVLVQRLPPGVRRGGEVWSTESELLAGLIDHVAMLTWVVSRLAGGKATKPKPVPRPRDSDRLCQPAALAAENGHQKRGGPVKYSKWSEAIEALMGMPGVRVE